MRRLRSLLSSEGARDLAVLVLIGIPILFYVLKLLAGLLLLLDSAFHHLGIEAAARWLLDLR